MNHLKQLRKKYALEIAAHEARLLFNKLKALQPKFENNFKETCISVMPLIKRTIEEILADSNSFHKLDVGVHFGPIKFGNKPVCVLPVKFITKGSDTAHDYESVEAGFNDTLSKLEDRGIFISFFEGEPILGVPYGVGLAYKYNFMHDE